MCAPNGLEARMRVRFFSVGRPTQRAIYPSNSGCLNRDSTVDIVTRLQAAQII